MVRLSPEGKYQWGRTFAGAPVTLEATPVAFLSATLDDQGEAIYLPVKSREPFLAREAGQPTAIGSAAPIVNTYHETLTDSLQETGVACRLLQTGRGWSCVRSVEAAGVPSQGG